MNSPRRSEMDKLRAIQSQLLAVTDRIATRLPTQRGHLAALVCARKWRLATLSKLRPQTVTQDSMDTIVKKMRMEIGAFEYSTKEQSELLTRALFQLDDILSHGDAEIKDTRKALVLSIQAQLERADALKASAAKLKEFTESVIATFPTAPVEEVEMKEEEEAGPEAKVEAETPTDASMETTEEASGIEVRALFDEDEAEEEEPKSSEDAEVKHGADEPMEGEEETVEDEADDDEEEEEEEGEDEEDEEEKEEDSIDIRSLPVWRPYYQIQQRGDGVYLQANLHGVDPRHIRVEAMPHNGVVRISGFKLPTQKDLILSRFSGQPTFGRFEIVERFPTNQLSLDHATQQLTQDGTLQVRLPFYVIQRPRIVRRVSPFQPHRLAVW